MYDLGDDGEYDAYSEYQRESTMDSRYSESLNALIGHPNASWSPNTIKNCECCNKEFKFTRRRHRKLLIANFIELKMHMLFVICYFYSW